MKGLKGIIVILCAVLTLVGCSSALKLYQKGNYYGACERAISTLKSKPNDSQTRSVLSDAYNQLVIDIDRQASQIGELNTVRKCDAVIANYIRLDNIYKEIMRCPAAMEVITAPVYRQDEIDQIRVIAAQLLYNDGVAALSAGTIEQARAAVSIFNRVKKYVPTFKDVNNKIAEATYKATLRVVVLKPQISARYSLDADFFYNKLMNDINRRSYRTLTKFYTPQQAEKERIEPHQLFVIEFIDFVVGNSRETEKTTDVKRENVELNKGVFGTASGRYTLHRLEIISNGTLGMRVVDPATKKIINQRQFNSQSVWATQWASFRGDDRALSKEELSFVGRRPLPVPPPQELFASFADPLYAQVANYINTVYPYY